MKTEPDRRSNLPARQGHGPWLLWTSVLALLPSLALAAGPPEVVRVRVPSDKVSAFFPPGTELRGFSADPFEALVESARVGSERQAGCSSPRLLRARHFARWDVESGMLIGRSELVVEPSPGGPSELFLSPWSPAIDISPAADTLPRVYAREDGATAVWVDATETATVGLSWQLRARPGSKGRGFTLGLPATETASLELDLPEGWVPEGPRGIRQGLEPGTGPRRTTWRFEGRGGPIELHLSDRDEGRNPRRDARIWVAGPTRIELLETSANWTMEWSVDAGPRGPRQFAIELDAGLELIDVTGPGVDGYRAQVFDATTRVTVRLADDAAGPTPVSVRAIARVPSEGPWTIPAARPLDALWTGGTTSVRLDVSRVLEGCRERSGRRVVPAAGERSDPYLLIFEAREPLPVAELVFRRPWADVSTEVRGQLFVGSSAPRLEGQITWRVHRGVLLDLDVDLPPAWIPDRVRIEGVDEPLAWHPEVQPGGGVRVQVIPPAGLTARNPLVMTVEATATVAGGRGPLDLPRVRPLGGREGDELWIAWTNESLSLRPVSASGLVWVDPRLVVGASAGDEAAGASAGAGSGGLRGALAWRWIAAQAEARVDREQAEIEPSGTVDLRATVARDRVRYDWRISIEAGDESLATIPIGASEALANLGEWHFDDESTGIELRRRPIDARRRAALGFPETGPLWEWVLPHPRRGRVTLRSRSEQPWSGRGRLPLLLLPGRFHARGTVVIEVDRTVRSTVEASGLRILDPTVAGRGLEIADPDAPDDSVGFGLVTTRLAHAFGYSAAGGQLELRTENLESARTGGVIREAILTTWFHPQGASRHHLTLRIAADRAQSLDLTMPAGAVLARVRRDGQVVFPTRVGKGLSIPLVLPIASRSFCTVTLEYLSGRGVAPSEAVLRPERPTSSFPCLSFCWEIVAPEPWAVAGEAPGLTATDPAPAARWPIGWDRAWRALTGRWGRRVPEAPEAALLRGLDARVQATRPDEVTLGEWFTRWDSGPAPLVIDRLSLASAGLGPKSRVVPTRHESTQPGAARAALRPLGLTVVPIGGMLLITTRSEDSDRTGGPLGQPGPRAEYEAALQEAAAWGSDGSDRFQSVTRWRGEATPKVTIMGEPAESEPLPEGWRRWRFAAPDWPDPFASVPLIDEGRRAAWGWTLGLAIVLGGIAGRRFPARPRASVLTGLLTSILLALILRPTRDASIAGGALAGALAVVILWLGESIPRRGHGQPRESRSPSSMRMRNSGAITALLVVTSTAILGLAARGANAPRDADSPIIALFPYDGPPDPDRRPDRVVIRWQDAERLQRLATLNQAPTLVGVRALAATHHVSWPDAREVAVDSEFALERGEGPSATWEFPVEDAREITATLDGCAVPVQVRPEGRTAVVLLGAKDRQRLRIRRVVAPNLGVAESMLRLAINPVATARVLIDDVAGRSKIDVPSARGRLEPRAGGVAGLLGPADRLEVRWSSGVETEPAAPAGTVEGLLLWDAEPAGDHIRARLTYRKPGGTSTLRLRLEPGLVLRPDGVSGLVDATWEGTDDAPEWVGSVDPPLPDGATIQLEFWRPAPDSAAKGRLLPRIEPRGVERYSGALAFRRPAEWSGRLAAGAGFEPMTDEAFVKAWGDLSDEPWTLAGTIRFLSTPTVALPTGPPPCKQLVEPDLQLAIESGRIAMDLRANLVSVSGRCQQFELELPKGVRIVAIEADGLTDWSRPAADRVRLRFDGTSSPRREARIRAWLPVPSEPLATGGVRIEVEVPWPRWIDVDERPGKLTIASTTRFQLLQAMGVTSLATNISGAMGPGTNGPYRATYRIDRPEAAGRLSWDVEPARVAVLVQSQLTIQPDFAEWVAVLRYEVSGGAADFVHLRLPAAWAASARVKVLGDAQQLTSETRGARTFWMIRPEHPIWGSQRLIVRAAIALPKTGEMIFPDLIPLGPGAVDSYLCLVNASGRAMVTEGSPGLQPLVDEARFRAEEFAGPPGVTRSVFHVRREGWSLKVQWPGETRPSGPGEDQARVSLADLACTLRSDGAVVGQASYEVEPRSGPFLTIDPPGRSEPLWASVNNLPAPPLRAASGRWLIPLGEEKETVGPVQVRVIWKTAPAPPNGDGLRALLLPSLNQPRVPTFVTVHAPTLLDVKSRNVKFENVPRERLEIARVEWQGKQIAETLGKLDRSSRRDCEVLISGLVQFELLLRDAERSARGNLTSPPRNRDVRISRLQERARIASTALAEAIRNAALDEFAESARIHLGLVADDPDSSTLEIPEPSTHIRIRCVGLPRFFQGETTDNSPAPALAWGTIPLRRPLDRPRDWVLVLLGVIAATLAAGVAVKIAERERWLGPVLLAVALIALAMEAGPLAFAGGLLMGWLGWVGASRPGRISPTIP